MSPTQHGASWIHLDGIGLLLEVTESNPGLPVVAPLVVVRFEHALIQEQAQLRRHGRHH